MRIQPTINIVSQGSGPTTHVTTPTGMTVEGVTEADIHVAADEVVTAYLTIALPHLDIQGAIVRQVTFSCDCCGEKLVHECAPKDSEPVDDDFPMQ